MNKKRQQGRKKRRPTQGNMLYFHTGQLEDLTDYKRRKISKELLSDEIMNEESHSIAECSSTPQKNISLQSTYNSLQEVLHFQYCATFAHYLKLIDFDSFQEFKQSIQPNAPIVDVVQDEAPENMKEDQQEFEHFLKEVKYTIHKFILPSSYI